VRKRHSDICSAVQLDPGKTKMASGIKIIKKDMMLKKTNIKPNEYLINLVIVSPSQENYT
jgi:RNase P/RNase MRP subunit p30